MFTTNKISYVTRIKDNALYEAPKEFDIPEDAVSGVLKVEEIELSYGEKKELKHKASRIAFWENHNKRLFEFITNNFDFTGEEIALIYKKRWQMSFYSSNCNRIFH